MKAWHLSDLEQRMYCNASGGKKIAMPRYYKDKLYTPEQRELIALFFIQQFQRIGMDDQTRLNYYIADENRKQYRQQQKQKL